VRQTRRPVRQSDAVLVAVPAQSLTLTTLALSTDSSCGFPLIGHTASTPNSSNRACLLVAMRGKQARPTPTP